MVIEIPATDEPECAHFAVSTEKYSILVPLRVVVRTTIRGAVLWGTVFGLVTWLEVIQFAKEYPTAADRAHLVAMMGTNVGITALFGPSPEIDTPAGYAATHAIGVLGILGAVWGLLAGTRALRGEEDAGRWEVLLAGATTARRATAAGIAGLAVSWMALWAVTGVIYTGIGRYHDARFAVTTAFFAAAATAAAAALFLAVGVLCAQIATSRRQAAALAGTVFGAAYLIRVVAYSTVSLRWLRWATPLGWVDETHPFIRSHWAPLLALAASIAVLVAATIVLAGTRDLNAGVLGSHDTARPHTRLLGGTIGLDYRLERGTVLGWGGGLAVGGLIVGLIAKGSADLWADQTGGLFVALARARGGTVYLGVSFLIIAFLVAMTAAGQTAATREEEATGRLDHLLARPVDRKRWLAQRFLVSVTVLTGLGVIAGVFVWFGTALTNAGLSVVTLLAAGMNVVPGGVLVLGLGTLAHGLAPRLTAPIAYGVVAWSFLLEIIGGSLGVNHWLLDLSVLHHISRAPAEAVNWNTAAILLGIGIFAAVAGAVVFDRRDLAGA